MLTDKLRGPGGHGYDTIYWALNLNPQRLLEIGTLNGGSMTWWRRRFPTAELHGIDLHEPDTTDGWTFHQGDGYTDPMCDAVWATAGFDLIVDDGPHTLESQVYVAANWVRRLRHGGTLIIEDIWTTADAETIAAALPGTLRDSAFVASTDTTCSQAPNPSRILVVKSQ